MDYRTRLAYAEQDLLTQSSLIRDLVAGLERLEWGGTDDCHNSYCPVCRRYKYPKESKHKDTCWLSALIKRGREGK